MRSALNSARSCLRRVLAARILIGGTSASFAQVAIIRPGAPITVFDITYVRSAFSYAAHFGTW